MSEQQHDTTAAHRAEQLATPLRPHSDLYLFAAFADTFDTSVCEFCGGELVTPDQPCPALDQGVCRP